MKNIEDENSLQLLRKLIQIETVTALHNEKVLVPTILEYVKDSLIEIIEDDVEKNRTNLHLSFGKTGGKHLVFNGHFDTVPIGEEEWEVDPFSAEINNKRVYGRGATDMKGGLAAMLVAFKRIADEGEINGQLSFIGTVGEEVDCIGVKKANEKGWFNTATNCIIAEPTANKICIAHKGVMWLKIKTVGKTAHGSMPHLGINAIEGMIEIIQALKKYEFTYENHQLLGKPTMNIGTIKGGVGTNVVPDSCILTVDIRTVPGQEHNFILEEIKKIINDLEVEKDWNVSIETINDLQSVNTPVKSESIVLAQQLSRDKEIIGVNYYTDGAIIQKKYSSLPILIYGPGQPILAHQPNEYIEISKFEEAIEFYYEYAKAYLA